MELKRLLASEFRLYGRYVCVLCRIFENSGSFRLGGGSRRCHRFASWILEIAFPAAPRSGRLPEVILLASSAQDQEFIFRRLCNGFDKKGALCGVCARVEGPGRTKN